MVRGLGLFRERFRAFEGSMALIGGAACDDWFSGLSMNFRATNDLDIVIMVDDANQDFLGALRSFIKEGQYKKGERSDGIPVLYRFTDPDRDDFPAKLEFSCRKPEGFQLSDGQKAIPIAKELGRHSLSAILLNDAYFNLIKDHHDERDGLWVANATSLIPLKAHAWLNLTRAKESGEHVDSQKIKKHRADVFRLAATLPGGAGPDLPPSIKTDLIEFLSAFPVGASDWPAILASVKTTVPGTLRPESLIAAIRSHFQLPSA